MRPFIIFWILIYQSLISFCQKKEISEDTYATWVKVANPMISDNGKFVSYLVLNKPLGNQTLFVSSTDNKWKKEFSGGRSISFLQNGIFALISTLESSYLLTLGKDEEKKIDRFHFSILDKKGNQWVGYTENNSNILIIEKLGSSVKRIIQEAQYLGYFHCNNYGNVLLIYSKNIKSSNYELIEYNFVSNTHRLLWQSKNRINMISDANHAQIIFNIENKANSNKKIWHYVIGEKQQTLPKEIDIQGLEEAKLDAINRFSNDGTAIFVSTKAIENPTGKVQTASNLTIWNYKDQKSQQQFSVETQVSTKSALLKLNNGQLINLSDNSRSILLPGGKSDEWLIEKTTFLAPGEINKNEYHILSTKTGVKKAVSFSGSISPDGKYYVYFDNTKKKYFARCLSKDDIIDISKSLSADFSKNDDGDDDVFIQSLRGIAGWAEDGLYVFIYDQYDIWKFDLKGIQSPKNITQGLGRRNKIVFNIIEGDSQQPIIKKRDYIYASAFNKIDKTNGFYTISLAGTSNPQMLYMENVLFYHPTASPGLEPGLRPIKAKNVDVYLVQKMSTTKSPNYFITKNFKEFDRVSNVIPESGYNWFTSELHKWKNNSIGREQQGVLYKPDNFDPNKKYPVILYYYRKSSDGLNRFIQPEYSDGRLNIPWYVSNGFLVFTPDIHFKNGETGKSALQSILSATKYLSTQNFVDSKKLGIQGISFGGFETNYIVAHTDIFSAACSASGLSDFVSGYNSINAGIIKQGQFEDGPYQIGGTLWENKQSYLDNSPVLNADKVKTPFLIMHTTDDSTVPIANAFEYYLALQRLGKKVWLLEYDNNDHGVSGKDAEDFDKRMRQFFEYYLKDKLPPKWMTLGRPKFLNGIDERLDLDSIGNIP